MRYLRILPAALLLGAAPAQYYEIVGEQSVVFARVAFFGLASKTARFPAVSGGITLDRSKPENIDLTVKLDAAALTAPDAVTLGRLKGPRFFDVANYPVILFRGSRLQMVSETVARVPGQLTARGITRPAVLRVRFDDPPQRAGRTRPLAINGDTTIDRRDFGMTAYPRIVGRKVTITIRAVMVPA